MQIFGLLALILQLNLTFTLRSFPYNNAKWKVSSGSVKIFATEKGFAKSKSEFEDVSKLIDKMTTSIAEGKASELRELGFKVLKRDANGVSRNATDEELMKEFQRVDNDAYEKELFGEDSFDSDLFASLQQRFNEVSLIDSRTDIKR